MSVRSKLCIFVAGLLVLDQVVKIWIKTHMMIGDEFNVFGDWFKIHFIENNGMAFGMGAENGQTGKILLSIFRIGAVAAIGWYISRLVKEKAPTGVIFSFVLIFCGAVGNILDSMFYGLLFNDSHMQVASFLPEGGGYAPFYRAKWWICYIFLSFPVIFRNGYRFGEMNISNFSGLCLIWPIRISLSALSY